MRAGGRELLPAMWRRYRHYVLADLRDLGVLFREFRLTLALFLCLVGIGTAVLHGRYVNPESGRGLDLLEALYAILCLIFVQPSVPFPRDRGAQALFFIVPIMGLALLGEGMVRFGVLLLNKRARKEEWQLALASTYSEHVVICGVGRLGYRIVEQLLACGEEIVAVEMNGENPFLAGVRQRGVPVILGDARDREVLEQAGVRRARAIIPCTENDLANLEIALDARELQPSIRVVLRMFDQELAEKVKRGFGIETAFSTSTLAAPAFAAAVACGGVSHALTVAGTQLHVAQFPIQPGSRLAGLRLAEVERRFGLSVILHHRKGPAATHPAPDTLLAEGDFIAVLAQSEPLRRIRRANGA
ncbi:MAG: TrkA family potassium uptake protein [Armatimonadetes bacterium]|nr:TrkA family potassium uptake protein [Armatimonadota bacterium]